MNWLLMYCLLTVEPIYQPGGYRNATCDFQYIPMRSEEECKKAKKQWLKLHGEENMIVLCLDAATRRKT